MSQKKGSCLLVRSIHDYVNALSMDIVFDKVYVASYSDYLKILSQGLEVDLYFPRTYDKIDNCYASKISSCWYRDQLLNDLTIVDGISLGNALKRRIFHLSSYGYYIFKFIDHLSKQFEHVYIPNNETNFFLQISEIFPETIKYNGSEKSSKLAEDYLERGKISGFPAAHKYSRLFRFIQNKLAFIFDPRKKILVFSDWTYQEALGAREDTLYNMKRRPWKAFFYRHDGPRMARYQENFPEELKDNIHFNPLLVDEICKENIKLRRLSCLMIEKIREEYLNTKDLLARAAAVYADVIDHYKPVGLVMPGTAFFAYSIAADIAAKRNICNFFFLDGYMLIASSSEVNLNEDGSRPVIDYAGAYGKKHRELLIDAGYSEDGIINIMPPYLVKNKSPNPIKKKYQAMVLAYYPSLKGGNEWGLSGHAVIELCNFLKMKRIDKIAIKVKSGGREKEEIKYYENLLDLAGCSKEVDVVGGQFKEFVNSSNIIIGQISTAVIESVYASVPYYIYEPDYLQVEERIKSFKILNRKVIARTLDELEENMAADYFGELVNWREFISDFDGCDDLRTMSFNKVCING